MALQAKHKRLGTLDRALENWPSVYHMGKREQSGDEWKDDQGSYTGVD